MEVFDNIDDAAGDWEGLLYLYILGKHAPPKKIRSCTKTIPQVDEDCSCIRRTGFTNRRIKIGSMAN